MIDIFNINVLFLNIPYQFTLSKGIEKRKIQEFCHVDFLSTTTILNLEHTYTYTYWVGNKVISRFSAR